MQFDWIDLGVVMFSRGRGHKLCLVNVNLCIKCNIYMYIYKTLLCPLV